jgi:acetoin utilization deacetylase AcuC-like enzyme
VHPEPYVDGLGAVHRRGRRVDRRRHDHLAGSWDAAVRGAGGAVRAVDLVLGGSVGVAASLHRPPGHHAEAARAMGFCLLNNVAIAARRALVEHGVSRVLVLDWDVHHGNGTNDIFHASDEVLFVSIHESPLYPGTGPASDVGSGAGEGYTVNVPVPSGSGDETFVSLVAHLVAPLARAYAPGLLLISAGFDAHAEDPLAGCLVTDAGFAAMAAEMRALGAELGVPCGLVLEGGYDLGALSRSLCDVLDVFARDAAPERPDVAVHPASEVALGRLAARWPALA